MKRDKSNTSIDEESTDIADPTNNNLTERDIPVPVSCSSSLDSFIMTLPSVEENGVITGRDAENSSVPQTSVSSNGAPVASGNFLSPSLSFSSAAATNSVVASNNHVPEFLYQLTKMLTDDNREIIEWSKGRIEVHNPHKLESKVLNRYFRHSKFASFQRQLNYFGFRKLAGKGKMAPCSYVNDAATEDLRSLLCIRRKPGPATNVKDTKGGKKIEASNTVTSGGFKRAAGPTAKPSAASVNPVLADILYRNRAGGVGTAGSHLEPIQPAVAGRPQHITSAAATKPGESLSSDPHRALARSAIGRGVRHNFGGSSATIHSGGAQSSNASASSRSVPTEVVWAAEKGSGASTNNHDEGFKDPMMSCFDPHESLSQLESNFRNSLNDLRGADDLPKDAEPTPLNEMRSDSLTDLGGQVGHFLPPNSSLIDLAMIPSVEDSLPPASHTDPANFGLCFVDFPDPDLATCTASNNNKNAAGEQREDAADLDEGNFF